MHTSKLACNNSWIWHCFCERRCSLRTNHGIATTLVTLPNLSPTKASKEKEEEFTELGSRLQAHNWSTSELRHICNIKQPSDCSLGELRVRRALLNGRAA
eukprot:524752-Amphidinium_carterae.2